MKNDTNHSIGDENTMGRGPSSGSGPAGEGYALSKGDVLGQYRIVRRRGKGGMGQVYEVEHTTLGRRYALKLLPEDFVQSANALERFKREAKVMANLEHPNIIRVDEFGETEGRYWLRMELAEGISLEGEAGRGNAETCTTLADLAKARGGKISQGVLLPILRQILAGLKHAHARGAVHRDLKPSNILLGGSLSAATVRVSDFGLVKLVGEEWVQSRVELSVERSMSIGEDRTLGGDSQGTSTRSLLGTYEYMSPEQKRGEEADARSDLYSIGLMVFKLLTGRELGMRTPSQIDPKLDTAWDELVLKALEERAEDRFQRVEEMAAVLPDGLPTEVAEEKPVPPPADPAEELTGSRSAHS